MKKVNEFCTLVAERMVTLGLKPSALVRMSGLSKSTVYEIQNGELKNLGLTKANKLLNTLGLELAVTKVHPKLEVDQSALYGATVFASTKQRKLMSVKFLEGICTHGNVHMGEYGPYLKHLLLNGDVALLASLADELNTNCGVGQSLTWARMRELAIQLDVSRDLWS